MSTIDPAASPSKSRCRAGNDRWHSSSPRERDGRDADRIVLIRDQFAEYPIGKLHFAFAVEIRHRNWDVVRDDAQAVFRHKPLNPFRVQLPIVECDLNRAAKFRVFERL